MFKKVAKASNYKERPLVKEFKRKMNEDIRRRLIEVEYSLKKSKVK